MQNTHNDIEALATANTVDLSAAQGSDRNMLEVIATDTGAALTYQGNDANAVEVLTAAIAALGA